MSITNGSFITDDLNSILTSYRTISLHEMEESHLMSRFDEKYVFRISKLKDFLQKLQQHYRILSVNHQLLAQYENLYFDTPELKSYHDHHNDRATRYKIRFRRYTDSGDCFFEIKRKDNRGFTNKKRQSAKEFPKDLSDNQQEFVKTTLQADPGLLQPTLSNSFHRITLVNTGNRERLTLDIMIHFSNTARKEYLDEVVIAEVKQERHFYESAFKRLMQHERIFPLSFSKYCMGTLLTHPGIKYNRFKPKLTVINKLRNEPS